MNYKIKPFNFVDMLSHSNCRQYISLESRSPEVPVKRSDLTLMVETAESARIKLYKQIEVNMLKQ